MIIIISPTADTRQPGAGMGGVSIAQMLGQVSNSGAEAVTSVEHGDESMVDRLAPVWVESVEYRCWAR